MMRDEMIDAVVIEADGVEHPRRRLDGARRRVALARLMRDGLRYDAAELSEIDRAGHFLGVSKSAGRHQDRVLHVQAAKCDTEVGMRFVFRFAPRDSLRAGTESYLKCIPLNAIRVICRLA